MFESADRPVCYWLPLPYTEEDQAEVTQAAEADGAEYVPWASLRRLADGMVRARKSQIRLLATEGDPADGFPTLAGWAAAAAATNVLTGAIAPAPPPGIEKTLGALRDYGNNGWSEFETNVGPMTMKHGQALADAGYGPDWVVGYFIGQGLGREAALRLHTFLSTHVTA